MTAAGVLNPPPNDCHAVDDEFELLGYPRGHFAYLENPTLAAIRGDHSVSFPLIRAFKEYEPLTIVLLCTSRLSKLYLIPVIANRWRWSSANNSPFRRAHELPFVKRIVTVGVLGSRAPRNLEHGNLMFSMSLLKNDGCDLV